MNNNQIKSLAVYGTAGCHLCELAYDLLDDEVVQSLMREVGVVATLIDIAEDPAFLQRYGVRIPVVSFGEQLPELGWPFDIPQLCRYLAEIGPMQR